MPGHRNVLLAEPCVSYDPLVEMGDFSSRTRMLLGDAKESLSGIIGEFKA